MIDGLQRRPDRLDAHSAAIDRLERIANGEDVCLSQGDAKRLAGYINELALDRRRMFDAISCYDE